MSVARAVSFAPIALASLTWLWGGTLAQEDWTDIEYAEEKQSYYFIGKTLAEK